MSSRLWPWLLKKSACNISKDMVDGDASALKGAFDGLGKFCDACRKVFRMAKQT